MYKECKKITCIKEWNYEGLFGREGEIIAYYCDIVPLVKVMNFKFM